MCCVELVLRDFQVRLKAERLAPHEPRGDGEHDDERSEHVVRATGLRSVWKAEIVDLTAAVKAIWTNDREAFRPLVEQIAAAQARGARQPIDGVTYREERVA